MKNKLFKTLALILAVVFMFAACSKAPDEDKKVSQNNPGPSTEETKEETAEETKEETKEETAEETGLVPEEGASLIVWEAEGYEKDFVLYAIEEFNKLYPDVTIEYQPVGHTDAQPKIALDGPNGEGADVFAAPHDHLGGLVTAGLVLKNDLLNTDEYLDPAIVGTTYAGTLYGYPTGIETYALFYNKDIVDEPAETFEEIIEFSKTFNDPTNNRFALMWEAANAYFNYLFLGGYGADLFGPNGDDKNILGFDSQAGTDAMTFYQSLRQVYDVEAADTTWDPMMLGFKENNAAYMINGPWAIQTLKDDNVNFGITTLPLLPNGKNPKSFSGIRANYVSAFTEYPNAAKLFAAFMSSKEMLEKRFEITSQIPPREDITVSDELIQGVLDQAAYAVPMPSIPEMGAYWGTMGGAFGNIWNGADVQTELEAAASAMREAFGE